MLTHRNWKFEKFMTEKIQTNDLDGINATTGDNIVLKTNAVVIWKIMDIEKAARNAAETMRPDGKPVAGDDITKLRNDVLKQATASLSAFIGAIRFSDTSTPSSVAGPDAVASGMHESARAGSGLLFDVERLKTCVKHANHVCNVFGVEVVAINIISAYPADHKLQEALSAAARAAAEAEQQEVLADGKAKALLRMTQAEADATRMSAAAEADALRVKANAEADAERARSQGILDGSKMLESSSTAMTLAKIDRTGEAMTDKTTFFFGGQPQDMQHLLANPGVVKSGGMFG